MIYRGIYGLRFGHSLKRLCTYMPLLNTEQRHIPVDKTFGLILMGQTALANGHSNNGFYRFLRGGHQQKVTCVNGITGTAPGF